MGIITGCAPIVHLYQLNCGSYNHYMPLFVKEILRSQKTSFEF